MDHNTVEKLLQVVDLMNDEQVAAFRNEDYDYAQGVEYARSLVYTLLACYAS